MRAEAGVRPVPGTRRARPKRRRARTVRRVRRLVLWAVGGLGAVLLATGIVYAGSASRIPGGVTIAGAEVEGLNAPEARARLSRLAARVASEPVAFTAGEGSWSLTAGDLDLRARWAAAVQEALDTGDGPIPLRGLERLRTRLFGADVEPSAGVYEPGLQYRVGLIAEAVDASARDARIVLSGLEPEIVGAQSGLRLDRDAARAAIVAALVGFERDEAVALPFAVDEPEVTREALVPVLAQVRRALSAPVDLVFNGAEVTVEPKEIAGLLKLPADGRAALSIDRAEARRVFENLARGVQRAPVGADFVVGADGKVRVARSRSGRELDLAATSQALLAAATGTGPRRAEVSVLRVRPELTTAEARALHVERQLASYTTLYSGTADRIVNLQRAIALLDGARLAPGEEFSFNRRVGDRTEERGFRPAPVIVNAEYEVDIGGGVSQVATTLFNAAWEAGLKISSRTAHALYIDRYPLGRDATVNYPDIDLRFTNDTGRWLVLDATYDESGISIGLLGAGRERRVVSQAGELEETGPPRVERKPDPTLYEGERVVEDFGEPSRAVRVVRLVYLGDEELYRETWYSSYRGEARIVRVGTKPRPEEPAPPKQEPKPKPKPTDAQAPGGA